jgi:hypothetical protein
MDWLGQDDRPLLTALRTIAESGCTPAVEKLAPYGRWNGSVDPVLRRIPYWKGPTHRAVIAERSDEAIQAGWIATGACAPSR